MGNKLSPYTLNLLEYTPEVAQHAFALELVEQYRIEKGETSVNAKMAIWTVTAKSLGSSVEATKPSRHRISTARKVFAKNGALVAKRRQIDPRSSFSMFCHILE